MNLQKTTKLVQIFDNRQADKENIKKKNCNRLKEEIL